MLNHYIQTMLNHYICSAAGATEDLTFIIIIYFLSVVGLQRIGAAGGTCGHGGFTRESDVVMNRRR
jgi:hypothetical protein